MEPTLLSLSYWYGSGHEKRDLWMMLMFLVFAIAMRMPCLYSRCTVRIRMEMEFCTLVSMLV
ncbi:hypothetical protein HID58_065771 [Brassica napus]|uniref:Uncharacterized protein n=1 Tax=Brassica napus TaxID=3708 RepID=A0ABQ7ZE89_BRANA|nr:hypothetical protein HID58_065771 [Brassica napus]